jgi:hypothetical protein
MRVIAGAALAAATGCASYAGWGPAPPMTNTPVPGHGAPRFVETSGLGARAWRPAAVATVGTSAGLRDRDDLFAHSLRLSRREGLHQL